MKIKLAFVHWSLLVTQHFSIGTKAMPLAPLGQSNVERVALVCGLRGCVRTVWLCPFVSHSFQTVCFSPIKKEGLEYGQLPAVDKKMWTNAQATVGGRAFVAPVGGLIHCRDVAKYEVQLPARR